MYYGDEILMGDNIYLGDRDGVRTPMQWTPDRNGGFSKADFARLYLPSLMDPVYGFAAVNVESQQRNPSSFLHWISGCSRSARRTPSSASGPSRCCRPRTPSVLAFIREAVDEETGCATSCCASTT
jgi:maltose alpha-D-glucosyltransferase/alpha-amylase